MATKKVKKKIKRAPPKQPRFVLDGRILYISVDDLVESLWEASRRGIGVGQVVDVLNLWKKERLS